MDERRKHQRIQLTWMAMCKIHGGQNLEIGRSCEILSPIIKDLNSEGMKLIVWRSDVSENLTLNIVMPALNISEYIEVLGKVKWCKSFDSERCDIGVQIIEFIHGSKEKLQEIINK